MRFAVDMTKGVKVEARLHQESALRPSFLAMGMESRLRDEIEREFPRIMAFEDDVVIWSESLE